MQLCSRLSEPRLCKASFDMATFLLLSVIASSLAVCSSASLWGPRGTEYVSGPTGRLLDFSYAGYAAGEADIPNPGVTASVKQFGAKGDGRTDDTDAFKRAIDETGQGVLFIPAGRYIIKEQLQISKPLTLRGAGSDETTLVFPHGLGKIYNLPPPQDVNRDKKSRYSFGEGFISYDGKELTETCEKIGDVVGSSRRGTNSLRLTSLGDVSPGEWVTVVISNKDGWLFYDMNQKLDMGCRDDDNCKKNYLYSFTSRVAATRGGNILVLERPLPFNVSTAFTPAAVLRYTPSLANVGVEGLGLEMQSQKYLGHWREWGYNGIQFRRVHNGWIRDIKITGGADLGIIVRQSNFITVENIYITAPERRLDSEGKGGHYGIAAIGAVDTLIQDVTIDTVFEHDISVNWFTVGVVYSRISGQDLSLDHHRAGNYGTLWTEIDVGLGTKVWQSGGSTVPDRGLHAGSFTTFWNVYASSDRSFGCRIKEDFGTYLNFVGVEESTRFPRLRSAVMRSWHIDSDMSVENLYEDQKSVRLSEDNNVSYILGGLGDGGEPLTRCLAKRRSTLASGQAKYRLRRWI